MASLYDCYTCRHSDYCCDGYIQVVAPQGKEKENMKIEKAIEILELHERRAFFGSLGEIREAYQLGIEALKRLRDMRTSPCTTADECLTGETEE